MIDDDIMDVSYWSDDGCQNLLLLAVASTLSNFTMGQPNLVQNTREATEKGKKGKKLRWYVTFPYS